MPDRAIIYGLPVDPLCRAQLPEVLRGWLQKSGQAHRVVTLNVNMLMLALRNKLLFQAIQEADLVAPDGSGIVRALRRRGYPTDRVTGLELTRHLLQIAASERYSVFCYGGGVRVCRKLAERLSRDYPELPLQAVRDGYQIRCSPQMIQEELRAAPPRLLLVGLGTPAQELFLQEIMPFLPDTVGVGVGGVLEILAGMQRQAPQLLQEHGLEWLFRMIQEPRRLNRLPDLARFWWQEFKGGE